MGIDLHEVFLCAIAGGVSAGGVSFLFLLFERCKKKKQPDYVISKAVRQSILTISLVCSFLAFTLINAAYQKPLTVHQGLTQMVDSMNKVLPKKVDDVTILQKVGIEGEKTLVYNYTVTVTFTSAQFSAAMEKQRLRAVDYWCRSPSAAEMRKLNNVIVYRYKDSQGAALGEFSINIADFPK